jgi:hypothetical protein
VINEDVRGGFSAVLVSRSTRIGLPVWGEVEVVAHVEFQAAVRVEVAPEESGKAAQGEGGQHLDVLAVVAGQVAGLAVEDVLVRAVPILHHVQSLVDLLPECLVGEVVADYVESDLSSRAWRRASRQC